MANWLPRPTRSFISEPVGLGPSGLTIRRSARPLSERNSAQVSCLSKLGRMPMYTGTRIGSNVGPPFKILMNITFRESWFLEHSYVGYLQHPVSANVLCQTAVHGVTIWRIPM